MPRKKRQLQESLDFDEWCYTQTRILGNTERAVAKEAGVSRTLINTRTRRHEKRLNAHRQ